MKEGLARQYGDFEQWHWWFRGRTRILESVLRSELRENRDRRILSIGCGPATGLTWLLPFAGERGRVVGLDLDPLHARDVPPEVKFVVGALPGGPIASESFDVVLALDVLEHLADDRAGLLEAARLVAPGGLLLLTVPALPSLWGAQDVLSEHYRRYTRKTLRELFAATPLRAQRMTYFNTALFPLVAAVRWSRKAIGAKERQESDFEYARPGVLNETLARIFGAERLLINHLPLPIGVSLLATVRPNASR